MRKSSLIAAALIATAGMARGEPLRVVESGFPDVNCLFFADCSLSISDSTGGFSLAGATGTGILQSRLGQPGEAGVPGAGNYPYLYRVNLKNLVGVTALPCVLELVVPVGPITRLDYDGDGQRDDVFVASHGGLGSIGVASAEKTGDLVRFRFETGACAGSDPTGGPSTFFFGFASPYAPHITDATVRPSIGSSTTVEARTPDFPARTTSAEFIRGDTDGSGNLGITDAISHLGTLFLGLEPTIDCEKAADANDDGSRDISDATLILQYVFLGGAPPAAPFPRCGLDPTPDDLTCVSGTACDSKSGECPDPAVSDIEFRVVEKHTPFVADVEIVGTVVNLGGRYDSSRGQQSVSIYEVQLGGQPQLVARRAFTDLAPGETVEVVFERRWNTSSPAEGEFPPTYRVAISYDPDITIDGNEDNDDCNLRNNTRERSGADMRDVIASF